MYAAERNFHKQRLCTPQNATSINGDCVDFFTTHLSLVHVITPDDLIGTDLMKIDPTLKMATTKTQRLSFLRSKFLVSMGIVILMCT